MFTGEKKKEKKKEDLQIISNASISNGTPQDIKDSLLEMEMETEIEIPGNTPCNATV